MCLTYLRLFLVKLYFCVPARVAINIKKRCPLHTSYSSQMQQTWRQNVWKRVKTVSRGMKKHFILNKNNFPRLQGQTSIQFDCTVIDEWPITPSAIRFEVLLHFCFGDNTTQNVSSSAEIGGLMSIISNIVHLLLNIFVLIIPRFQSTWIVGK